MPLKLGAEGWAGHKWHNRGPD